MLENVMIHFYSINNLYNNTPLLIDVFANLLEKQQPKISKHLNTLTLISAAEIETDQSWAVKPSPT